MHKDRHQPLEETNVVVLINYMRSHHVRVFEEIQNRVGNLTILLSTRSEPDQKVVADWGNLDVRLQKNWMYTTNWRHSSGYSEPNFIHVPIDTVRQLKNLRPDVVFSYEMGMRTALSCIYRRFFSGVPLVLVGNMSQHIERERGVLRRWLRKSIQRTVDYATYNGPSCKRYLESLGFDENELFYFPYSFDSRKVSAEPKPFSDDGIKRMLYCGALSERKGILPFLQSLVNVARRFPETEIEFNIAGEGPLEPRIRELKCDNLDIQFLGFQSSNDIRELYRQSDVCVYPTLGDEWGLVPVEAMASGLPVLGSQLAQSIETVGVENMNGWYFLPEDPIKLEMSIARFLTSTHSELQTMSRFARESVDHLTPDFSAGKFCDAIREIFVSATRYSIIRSKKSHSSDSISARLNHSQQDLATMNTSSSTATQSQVDTTVTKASVIIPCYNESETIPFLAERLTDLRYKFREQFEFEFVFVDDGSKDETFDLLGDNFAGWENVVIERHRTNQGIMAALFTGINLSSNEVVCTMDADCTFEPEQFAEFIPILLSDDDIAVVTASPYHPKGVVENVPAWRIWISCTASIMYRTILRNKLYCYTSCFRAYRKSACRDMEVEFGGFAGNTEVLWKIEKSGWKIVERPSTLKVRAYGQSKMQTWRVTLRHLKLMGTILSDRFFGSRNVETSAERAV